MYVCNVCMYVRMYVCTYVRMYVCMYVCMLYILHSVFVISVFIVESNAAI